MPPHIPISSHLREREREGSEEAATVAREHECVGKPTACSQIHYTSPNIHICPHTNIFAHFEDFQASLL